MWNNPSLIQFIAAFLAERSIIIILGIVAFLAADFDFC
jgi:hypothetical protein